MGRTVDEEVLKDTVRPDQQIRSASGGALQGLN
jgi:hypothetical protein